jgi:hypothetical protein
MQGLYYNVGLVHLPTPFILTADPFLSFLSFLNKEGSQTSPFTSSTGVLLDQQYFGFYIGRHVDFITAEAP